MTEQEFDIVFEGDILPGNKQKSVQAKLAKIFAMKADEASELFTGKQHKLKSRVPVDKAKKYIFAMAKLGALAYMIPVSEAAVQAPPPAPVDGKFTETGSFDVSAYSAFFTQKEKAREEPEEKSSDYKIFSFDEIDAPVPQENSQRYLVSEINEVSGPHEISGVNKIMEINEITKKVINQKTGAQVQNKSNNALNIEEVASKRTGKEPDPDEISGMQKIMDLKEIGKAVKKHKDS